MTYEEVKTIITIHRPKMTGLWLHVKTGKHVYIFCLCFIENPLAPGVCYFEVEDSQIPWIRPLAEFLDGRFVKVE